MPIIHLGATSCFVGDNTDIIQIHESMLLLRRKMVKLINNLSIFANTHKALPTLGFTHFQPAQPVTYVERFYSTVICVCSLAFLCMI